MNSLWKFILILFGLLTLGVAVVVTFRVLDSDIQIDMSLPSFGGDGPARLTIEPMVVRFKNVGGRAVLRNYRVEIEVDTSKTEAEVGAMAPKLRDAFIVQLLDLSEHAWHSAGAPATSAVERRLLAAGRETVGSGFVKSVVVMEVTESPAPRSSRDR